ncbi:DUF4189 domain-containing protein [Falsiroseomonas sp. CW058]|uniref:DUF4189 domain-containing protein n=1 Tax=Falsiroseomonas sp. CW058 TaxID=3388664 RepID=UPI003D31DA5A
MQGKVGAVLVTLLVLAGIAAPRAASAQVAGEQCRATCAAMPRDDRARLLACLQRCGVAVQQAPQGRLVATSGYGRRTTLPVVAPQPVAPVAIPAQSRPSQAWGAIYAAPAPLPGLGVVAGVRDRLAAHGSAESACAAGSRGLPCRPLVEFTSGCAAAARAERDNRVAYTTAETGATRQAAESAALGACRARVPGGCRIVQTACIG